MAQYKQLAATNQTKVGAGKLKGIFVSAASGSPTMVIYDTKNAATTTKIIDTFIPVAATAYNFGSDDGIFFNDGLYFVIANTVSWTAIYE